MIVYYTATNNSFVEPFDTLFYSLKEKSSLNGGYDMCPAMQEYIKNTYVVKSTFDYEISWNKENQIVKSSLYDQKFFENNVLIRDIENGLISYCEPRLIFFAEKDLEMAQISPFMHNTLNRHIVLPGKYNIGKHFRALEIPIQFLHSDVIKIKEKDPLYYLQFYTDEKIVFKKFLINDVLHKLMMHNLLKRNYTKKILPLKWYYENSLRNNILKEIKNNLF